MKWTVSFMIAVMISLPALANTEMAKEVLSQTTTNPFCSAGYDGPNPYEKNAYEAVDQAKSICAGKDVVKCYYELYKKK